MIHPYRQCIYMLIKYILYTSTDTINLSLKFISILKLTDCLCARMQRSMCELNVFLSAVCIVACLFETIHLFSNTFTHLYKYIHIDIYVTYTVYTSAYFVMRRFRFASMNNRFSMSLFPLIIHAIYICTSHT